MGEEKQSIKELLELLEGMKLLALDGKKVLADGKVNLADIPVAMELLGQLDVLGAAVRGADQIPSEVKDLSLEEAQQIIAKVLEIAAALKAA